MSPSANDMMGTQLSLSQTYIISQSEVKWGGSWKNVLQPVCGIDTRAETSWRRLGWRIHL